jgi:hypothetical protein
MQGIQPSSLTPEELFRYAYLELDARGLPKDWCEALLKALATLLDERQAYLDSIAATNANT